MNIAAYVVAVVLFALAAFGVQVDTVGYPELVAAGLAAFTLGHVLPR